MDQQDERIQLSRNYRRFQLYSLEIALGCLSAFLLLLLDSVKQVFVGANITTFYALFLAGVVIIGIVAFIFSGGVGLFRLINAKRLIKMIERDEHE